MPMALEREYEGLAGSDISPVPDLLVFICIATFKR